MCPSLCPNPKSEDVDRFFMWIYTDWAEPMPTADIDGHMKERGQATSAKLAEVRALLGHTMSQSDLSKLGPRHMERMTITQLNEMHSAWTSGDPRMFQRIVVDFQAPTLHLPGPLISYCLR